MLDLGLGARANQVLWALWRQVVLGVAGTHSVADCLTDCLCDGQAYEQGVAHRGAAEAANWLCEEHGELLKALEEPTGGDFHVISIDFY